MTDPLPGSETSETPTPGADPENPLQSLTTMILAAGLGTRVFPLSQDLPKALLPVCGRPLLEWNLRFLGRAGIREVVVNAHHLTESVEDWHGRELPPEFVVDGVEIPYPHVQLVREPVLLGTAGGVSNASPLLRSDPVLIWNVDLLFQPDLCAALEFHQVHQPLATLLLVRDPQFAKIALDGDRITSVAPLADPADASLWAYTGVALLSQKAIAELPSGRFEPLPPHLRRWARAGELAGFRCHATFREVGTLEGYWEIHRELKGPLRNELLVGEAPTFSREPGGFGFIAAGATVSPNSHVEESIILGGAEVAEGADVRRSILGVRAHIDCAIENIAVAGDESRPLALLPYGAEAHLEQFLAEHLATWPKEIRRELKQTKRAPRIRRLQGDGSGRQILRVTAGACSRIAIFEGDPTEGTEPTSIYPVRELAPGEAKLPTALESFLYMHELFDGGGIRVPKLLATDLDVGLLLLEDLGLRHLVDQTEEDGEEGEPHPALKLYEEAIDILVRIHDLTASFDPERVPNPSFDLQFGIEYEGGYFLRQFVSRMVDSEMIPEATARSPQLTDDLARLAGMVLGDGTLSLIHRDFQSRNLMLRNDHLVVIDFQGARLGPATYDLASLLYDPYNNLSSEDRNHLEQRYLDRRPVSGTERDATASALPAAALQRLLQNLGAFAYLGRDLGKPGFWEHVPVALERARTLAEAEFPTLCRVLTECATNLDEAERAKKPGF